MLKITTPAAQVPSSKTDTLTKVQIGIAVAGMLTFSIWQTVKAQERPDTLPTASKLLRAVSNDTQPTAVNKPIPLPVPHRQ